MLVTKHAAPQRSWVPVLALAGILVLELAVHQWGIWTGWTWIATATQLAMSLTATVIVALFTRGLIQVLGTVGMLGCFAGDLVPRFIVPPTTTLAIIAAFAMGQLFLVAAFWGHVDWRSPLTRWVGVLLSAYAIGLVVFLALAPGVNESLLGPTALYAVLIVLMTTTASVNRLALLGAICFVASDSILATKLLGVFGPSLLQSSLLMGLYGLALLLLALGLVQLYRRTDGA